MIWAAVTLLAITVILLSGLLVLVTVQFRRTLERAFSHADSIHDRAQHAQSSLLDRFMALDFSIFKQYQAAETAEEGSFEMPDLPEPPPLDDLTSFPLPRPRGDVTAEERALLEQDFPEEMLG